MTNAKSKEQAQLPPTNRTAMKTRETLLQAFRRTLTVYLQFQHRCKRIKTRHTLVVTHPRTQQLIVLTNLTNWRTRIWTPQSHGTHLERVRKEAHARSRRRWLKVSTRCMLSKREVIMSKQNLRVSELALLILMEITWRWYNQLKSIIIKRHSSSRARSQAWTWQKLLSKHKKAWRI